MADIPLLDAPPAEILRRLQITVLRRLDGMLQGDYRGLVPGHGTEPGETRLYEPGDDVRRIDWNVTARTQSTHIRQSIADRELEVTLVVDLSASLAFGTARTTKRELAIAAASAVGFLSGRSGNRVAAALVTGGGTKRMPPRPGRDALLALLHRIVTTEVVTGQADLADGLGSVARSTRRRGLVVVISDFISDDAVSGQPSWVKPLRALAHKHEVLAIEITDPRELDLPDVGVISLIDPESGRSRTVTVDAKLRSRYAAAAAQQRAEVAQAIRRTGAAHLVLRTDRDWLVEFARFIADRRRLAAGTGPVRPQGASA